MATDELPTETVSAQIQSHPMIFSPRMVLALLSGTKTQTRRVINPQPEIDPGGWGYVGFDGPTFSWSPSDHPKYEDIVAPVDMVPFCPHGQVGDLIWVRETLQRGLRIPDLPSLPLVGYGVQYKADSTGVPYQTGAKAGYCGRALWEWRRNVLPSIHMPRWASRITLRLTAVEVQRLQAITEADAVAEGLASWTSPTGAVHYGLDRPDVWEQDPVLTYKRLWGQIHGNHHRWESNPWVWKLVFEVVA